MENKEKWLKSLKYGIIAAVIFCIPLIVIYAIGFSVLIPEWLGMSLGLGFILFIIFGIIFILSIRLMFKHWIGIFVPLIIFFLARLLTQGGITHTTHGTILIIVITILFGIMYKSLIKKA